MVNVSSVSRFHRQNGGRASCLAMKPSCQAEKSLANGCIKGLDPGPAANRDECTRDAVDPIMVSEIAGRQEDHDPECDCGNVPACPSRREHVDGSGAEVHRR